MKREHHTEACAALPNAQTTATTRSPERKTRMSYMNDSIAAGRPLYDLLRDTNNPDRRLSVMGALTDDQLSDVQGVAQSEHDMVVHEEVFGERRRRDGTAPFPTAATPARLRDLVEEIAGSLQAFPTAQMSARDEAELRRIGDLAAGVSILLGDYVEAEVWTAEPGESLSSCGDPNCPDLDCGALNAAWTENPL